MAYHIPDHGKAMNISYNQTYAPTSPFGDMMDMINEDAYEHDDDDFVDAPEHPEDMAGFITSATVGDKVQQTRDDEGAMDVDQNFGHSTRDFANDSRPGQQLQQQLDISVKHGPTYDHVNSTSRTENIGGGYELLNSQHQQQLGASNDRGQALYHAHLTSTNETTGGGYSNPEQVQRLEVDHSLGHALGITSNGINNLNLVASTLDSQTIVGDDQTVTSSHRTIKKARYNPEDEPKEIISIDKDTRPDCLVAFHAALKPVKKQPNQPSQHSQHALDELHGANGTPGIKRSESSAPHLMDLKHYKEETKSSEDCSDRTLLNPDKDRSRMMQAHIRFHNRTADLKPALELASHRYWVAVLHPGVKPRNATKEHHYLWFKANRLTTIETVWKIYSDVTATMDFVFLMAGMRLDWEEQLEGLDLFNDKVIVLRVYDDEEAGCEGKPISEGLVKSETEVIELD